MGAQSILNCCLVKIGKRYQDKDGKIAIDPTWQPEQYATLEGEVVSAPQKVVNDDNRTVIGKVNAGDKIIFSYGIVYDFAKQPDNDAPVYKNLIIIDGEEFWKVDMGEIFCKVGDELEMISDSVLVEPKEISLTQTSFSGITLIETKKENSGIVKALPKDILRNVRVGDAVLFEPRFVQKYNILGKEHFILPTRRVLAKANC